MGPIFHAFGRRPQVIEPTGTNVTVNHFAPYIYPKQACMPNNTWSQVPCESNSWKETDFCECP